MNKSLAPLPTFAQAGLAVLLILPSAETRAVDYTKDIKPLLRERCVSCHGAVKEKGDLRLDAGALIPKDSHGELPARVTSDDEDDQMPPEGARLSENQVALLREWITAGAPFPSEEPVPKKPGEHWSFQPVKNPPVPA